ncbi:MAG: hypothetical protein L0H15_09465, partial [Nitrosospira sp.]|nr:hypothetical protein [Nitrosospira sp.]
MAILSLAAIASLHRYRLPQENGKRVAPEKSGRPRKTLESESGELFLSGVKKTVVCPFAVTAVSLAGLSPVR